MTVVDDGWTTGFLVDEQEEVVTDQLHLVQGLVNGHRLGDVQLAADDDWGVADLDLDGFARAEISGNGVGRAIVRRFRLRLLDDDRLDRAQIDRDRIGVATTMVLAAVAGTAQTKRQLVESLIERAELVGAGGFGTHHGTTAMTVISTRLAVSA